MSLWYSAILGDYRLSPTIVQTGLYWYTLCVFGSHRDECVEVSHFDSDYRAHIQGKRDSNAESSFRVLKGFPASESSFLTQKTMVKTEEGDAER